VSKASRNRQIAREKIAKARAAEARRARQRRIVTGIGIAVVVAAVAVPLTLKLMSARSSTTLPKNANPNWSVPSTPSLHTAALSTLGTLNRAPPSGPAGGEGIPIPAVAPLAGTATNAPGITVQGIHCGGSEQLRFHIHAHVTIFVNGSQRQLPQGIGIIARHNCLYWLHTHYGDGIIHIESPVVRTYTLGDLFDIWGQPLGPNQVGPARGKVTAIYNGRAYVGNPRDIPLNAHAQIQLEIGNPLVAPQTITSWAGL
jgi:hypothetical protein